MATLNLEPATSSPPGRATSSPSPPSPSETSHRGCLRCQPSRLHLEPRDITLPVSSHQLQQRLPRAAITPSRRCHPHVVHHLAPTSLPLSKHPKRHQNRTFNHHCLHCRRLMSLQFPNHVKMTWLPSPPQANVHWPRRRRWQCLPPPP